MKVYIHEYADDTALILSYEGQVLGVYNSLEDAQDNYPDYTGAEEEIFFKDDIVQFDTAA